MIAVSEPSQRDSWSDIPVGGVFGIFAFIERPELFRGVVAASPALWKDDFVWVDRLRASLGSRPPSRQWLVVTRGGTDHPLTNSSFDRAKHVLETSAPPQLAWRATVYDGEHHSSARFPAYRDGLRYVFSLMWLNWAELAGYGVNELSERFTRLSTDYGWQLTPPAWSYWRLILAQDIAERPYAVIRTTAVEFSKQFAWHPVAYEGCYSFLSAPEDRRIALKCAEDALHAARRGGFWPGEVEAIVNRLRLALR